MRYIGEPVAAVAADTLDAALAALAAIELEIDPLPAVTEIDAAIADGAPLVHEEWETYASAIEGDRDGNRLWEAELTSGDVAAAFARDDVVVLEDEFRVPRQHQSYIEPRCAVAQLRDRPLPRAHLDSVPGACTRPHRRGARRPLIRGANRRRHRRRRLRRQARRRPRAVCRAARARRAAPGQARLHPQRGVRRRHDARERGRQAALGRHARRRPGRAGGGVADGRRRLRGRDASDRRDRDAHRSPGRTASARSATAAMPSTRTRRRPARSAASAGHTWSSPSSATSTGSQQSSASTGARLRMRNVYRPGDRMPNGQVLNDTAFAEAFERIENGRALGRGERDAARTTASASRPSRGSRTH